MNSTAKLIAELVAIAERGDSYTRDIIMKRVDVLIDLYIKEQSDGRI